MSDLVRMFVNGEAMSSGSIHSAIAGSTFIGEVSTAARYRFFSVRDEFPGLFKVARGGSSVPGELYELPYSVLRDRLLPAEPPELELSVIELGDGSGSLSMAMRADAINAPGVVEISDRGGWRAYLSTRP